MLAFGIFLVAVGSADLLRAARDTSSTRRRVLVTAIGLSVLLILLVSAGLEGSEWLGLGAGLAVGVVGWTLGSAAALTASTPAVRTGACAVAYGGLVVGAGTALLGGGVIEDQATWPQMLSSMPVATLPLVDVVNFVGAALVQLATANIAVRLLLVAVGVPAATNEKQLKGGRILGPMERLLILGLGIAGQFTATAVVIAAKGLLRFPELQREVKGQPGAPSDVTEYFLIGTFASWLWAMGGVAVIWVT